MHHLTIPFFGFFDPTTKFLISTATPWLDNWTLTLDFTLAPANLKNAMSGKFMNGGHKVTISDGNSWGRMHQWLSSHIGNKSNSVIIVLGTFSYGVFSSHGALSLFWNFLELAKAPPGKPLCLVTPGEVINEGYEPVSPPSPPARDLPSSRASSAPPSSTSQVLSDKTLVKLKKPCQHATAKPLASD